jgi:hypothetical protein
MAATNLPMERAERQNYRSDIFVGCAGRFVEVGQK